MSLQDSVDAEYDALYEERFEIYDRLCELKPTDEDYTYLYERLNWLDDYLNLSFN